MRFFAAAFSAHTRLCSHSEVYSECFSCLVVCLGAVAGSLECLECTFVRVLRAGAPFSQPLRCAALSGFFFAVCSCPAFIVFTVLFCCFVLLFFFVVFGFFGVSCRCGFSGLSFQVYWLRQLRCGFTSSLCHWLGCSVASGLLVSLFD